MGSISTVDPWLLELADRGRTYVQTAQRMGRIQNNVAHRTGHLLDLSARQVREKLIRSGHNGSLPRTGLRCSRCGAGATCVDWQRVGESSEDQRRAWLVAARRHKEAGYFAFIRNCPGEARADAIMEVLDAKQEGTIP